MVKRNMYDHKSAGMRARWFIGSVRVFTKWPSDTGNGVHLYIHNYSISLQAPSSVFTNFLATLASQPHLPNANVSKKTQCL